MSGPAVVVVDGVGRIVELHATIYKVSIANLLPWKECWGGRRCPCGFTDKTCKLLFASKAADRYSARFDIRVFGLINVLPANYGTDQIVCQQSESDGPLGMAHQAISSLLSSEAMEIVSGKPLCFIRSWIQHSKLCPEYLVAASPCVIVPLICFLAKIFLERLL